MKRRERKTSVKGANVRILVHVVHFYGSGSMFKGGSTESDAADRRATVERVVEGLRSLPYEMHVAICGIPGAALVPVDVDLGGVVEDPRHLAYSAIEALVSRVDDEFDFYMCVEDDILVPPDAVARMIRFRTQARINEVLLPNRLEEAPGGGRYCVDLVATPGWRRLRRTFEGVELGVADNPHSGLAFLSSEQLRYARRRIDLKRRDQFVGGLMASAFANLHLPFLLWRTRRDLDVHHALHLDPWGSPVARLSISGEDLPSKISGGRGTIDEILFDGVLARVRGWAIDSTGAAALPTSLFLDDMEVGGLEVAVQQRLDVAEAIPGTPADCGFACSFHLPDVPNGSEADRVSVICGPATLRAPWPRGAAAVAASAAPSIPDLPHMPAAAQQRLELLLRAADCYLEYGTGGSTMLAARIGVPVAYCVESDSSWLAALERRLRTVDTGARQVLIHADIGPTGDWGYPVAVPPGTSAADYSLAVWDRLERDGSRPDLVLVDGRYRVACFLATLLHAAQGTRILFDDYLDRPHYDAVEEVVHPTAVYDRVAEFVVPSHFDRERAWHVLAQHAGDAR